MFSVSCICAENTSVVFRNIQTVPDRNVSQIVLKQHNLAYVRYEFEFDCAGDRTK